MNTVRPAPREWIVLRPAHWLGWTLVAMLLAIPCLGSAQDSIEYNSRIRPLLADKCFACHGQDESHREADLRLDRPEDAYASRDGFAAIVPGDLDASEVWARINMDDDSRMPPVDHPPLTETEKDLIRRWIEQGAVYQQHWSFVPPVAVDPPQVDGRPTHPIDAFIVDRSRREGLAPAGEADRPTLIRRVAFALTGLPPTLEQVDAFLADSSPDAYERMVDQFLASPHYGEEMARHWLDVARYADTHGLHLDNERQMWAYRDWVIESFNRNQPFDQFTIDQLAGDLLEQPSDQQLIATGFNRCNVTTGEGGSIDSEWIYRYAVDRASTTAQAWMGLTAGCAQCHDHKYDPLTQKEFYSLYAFFHSAADPAMDGNSLRTEPVLKLPTDEDRAKLTELDERIAALQKSLEDQAAAVEYKDPALDQPPSEPTPVELVWMDDEFPSHGQAKGGPGHATQFVSAESGDPIFSGARALRRSDDGLSQDVWDQGSPPLILPADGVVFVNVWIDPADPPKALMLQFHKSGWSHRAVWGDYDIIPWGTPQTHEKVLMGELPATGEWVRLEVPIDRVGLAAGDALSGFATTQHGGTVFWDRLGIRGVSDAARDPNRSFQAWWQLAAKQPVTGLPPELIPVAQAVPEGSPDPELQERLRRHYLRSVCADTQPQFAEGNAALTALQTERQELDEKIPRTFVYKDLAAPRESFVMMRGQYDQPGEPVDPDVPAFLPPLPRTDPAQRATRLELARWLVSREHPLTARVAVNRIWQQLLGTGLVPSSEDFGIQGLPPSHPELLDWLAVHFRESGWDVKALVRLILTSATFRQDSRITADALVRDPANTLLARGPRFRLDAEQIRDNALFVSGLIDLTMGGKGVKPYQPPNIWEPVGFVGSNTRFYQRDTGSAVYRRSVYTFFKRTAPPPFLVNFDAPNREQICTRRERSNTPLQALQLMNDIQHVEAARRLAERMMREGGSEPDERIEFAFRTVLARNPDEAELQIATDQLAAHLQRYREAIDEARRLVQLGQSPPADDLPPEDLAAYTLVASTILNLDETLTRN